MVVALVVAFLATGLRSGAVKWTRGGSTWTEQTSLDMSPTGETVYAKDGIFNSWRTRA